MPNYDFVCPDDHVTEYRFSIADRPKTAPCAECGKEAKFAILVAPALPTTIVVDYPGSKKHKAGYVHSHADIPATRTQVGYGGAVNKPVAPVKLPGPVIPETSFTKRKKTQ